MTHPETSSSVEANVVASWQPVLAAYLDRLGACDPSPLEELLSQFQSPDECQLAIDQLRQRSNAGEWDKSPSMKQAVYHLIDALIWQTRVLRGPDHGARVDEKGVVFYNPTAAQHKDTIAQCNTKHARKIAQAISTSDADAPSVSL